MGKTILVIEDDPDINVLIKITLQSAGHKVISVLRGEDGLKEIHEKKVDAVLLDIIMPEMDGYQVIKILKSKKSTKDIPVIFVSSKTEEKDIEKGLSLNAAGYIKKPFDPEKLSEEVEQFLRGN